MKILGPVVDILDAIPLSEIAATPIYVDHGATAGTPRPSTIRPVIWRGSVEPTNMINGDEWEQEGVSYQPLDSDLTQLAALDSGTAGTISSDGTGWVKKTYAQFKTALALVKADVGLANVDNTSDAAKPVSTAQQTALNLKANLASPTFTGTVSGISKSMVGLGSVDNTSDAAKPVSTAQQTALNLKANLASPTFTGTVGGITKSMVGLANVDNTSDAAKPISTAQQTALDAKAPIDSPTFTGTVSGITKSMVGLANVDNTADSAKPISTAQQTALDAKAPIASPTFTGTVGGITKAMVGLANVDNTADSAKPVSTAQQTALNAKQSTSEKGAANGYASLGADAKVPSAQIGPKTLRIPHTWHIPGDVKVASGATDFINPMWVPVPAGATVTYIGVVRQIQSGTSVTFDIRLNGTTFAASIVANTTEGLSTTGNGQAIADINKLVPVVTAVSGTPKNLAITVILEYTF